MSDAVPSQPADSHTLTPYLAIRDAPAAIDFYKQAFGASENNRLEWGDGSIMHCELQIGDSVVMAAGFPETADLLWQHGRAVTTVELSELQKAEAGGSCMSLIFEGS